MAIALEGRLMWRREAPFHVQLAVEREPGAGRATGQTHVEGRVVRVFRTDGRLSVGDTVTFPIWVCRAGDEPTGPAYIYTDEFRSAAYFEVYLHGIPPACELAAYEFGVLESPSEQPTLTPGQLEELLAGWDQATSVTARTNRARKWWQFWRATHGG